MQNDVVTFGCRLNIYESEIIKSEISSTGLKDFIIFNSCAVTSEAERQLRQSIRKHKKLYPNKKIILTGCAAQIASKKYQAMEEIDYILGNKEKLNKENYQKLTKENKVIVKDIMQVKDSASHLVENFDGKARGFIEIQNGCNHRCTYCIIPYGRGNNRSHTIAEITNSCNNLVNQGYNEIVLTGVDITDYGQNLPGKPKLGQLVKRILNNCPNLKRLRLSSLDVAEIDDELLELIQFEQRLMPHIHLSLQSGDNMILKRMKRRHNREQIYEFCEKIRKVRNNVAFGADIITGFPTETEEMFLNSYNLVKELSLSHLHIFPYSERDNTPAARIPQSKQVPKDIRKIRAKKLIQLGEINLINFKKSLIGRTLNTIIESNNMICSEEYIKIKYNNNYNQGDLIKILIKSYDQANNKFEIVEC